MKIREIHIYDYKIFEELKIDFINKNGDTLNTIVLAGINGTGKTTLLELIIKLLYNQEPFLLDKFLDYISIEVEFTDNELIDFTNFIKKYDEYEVHTIVFEGNIVRFEKEVHVSEFYNEETNEIENYYDGQNNVEILQEFLIYLCNKSSTKFQICYFYDHLQKYDSIRTNILKVSNFDLFYKDLNNYFTRVITKHLFENRKSSAEEVIINKIKEINNSLEGIDLSTKIKDIVDNYVIFESLNGTKISFSDLSAGEKMIFHKAIYLNALNLENSIIIVDEPEISLHPKWQKSILKLYENIGKNNQIIVSTHSPHIIGSCEAENVFLFKSINNKIVIDQPQYSKGHSIPFVLLEIMDTNYTDTETNKKVQKFLELIRQNKHNTKEGKSLYDFIKKLSPDSEERMLVDLSLDRFKVLGK